MSPRRIPSTAIATAVVLLASATVMATWISPSTARGFAPTNPSGASASTDSNGPGEPVATQAQLKIDFGPTAGPNQSGSISIQAVPVEASAVSQVYFYIDNSFEGTALAAPYCLGGSDGSTCNPFNTTLLRNGSHIVKAYMSYDMGSLESDAALDVDNAQGPPGSPTTTTTTTSPLVTGGHLPNYPSTPFVGLNAYELASDPGVNLGCGTTFSGQWNSFFSTLPPGTVVRFWATQQMATSPNDPQVPQWTALDSVFSAATAHGVHLIPILANEWTDCDGAQATQKHLSWFQSGYRSNTDEGSLPYLSWVQAIVARYAQSPATFLWEPVNEPQPTDDDGSCTESSAAEALRSFYDAVGGAIHSIDPAHGVESGFIGEGNCGTANDDYGYVGASSGISVLSYHDYYAANQVEGGDQWNGIAVRTAQAAALGKPILAGEDGITAGQGCQESLAQRADDFTSRAEAQFAAGASGMLLWNWEWQPTDCTYDIGPGDPALRLLRGIG